MSERMRVPAWGPAMDPPPDDPFGGGPWWWGAWWRRKIPFPPWDPPDLLDKLNEVIKPEDVIALEHAKLGALRAELDAAGKFASAQVKAQLGLIEQQMEILAKYRG